MVQLYCPVEDGSPISTTPSGEFGRDLLQPLRLNHWHGDHVRAARVQQLRVDNGGRGGPNWVQGPGGVQSRGGPTCGHVSSSRACACTRRYS